MFGPLQGIVQDTRYALRTLRTSPAFTIAAIGTLALGIGADRQVMSLVMKEAAVLVAISGRALADRLAADESRRVTFRLASVST